MMSLHSEGPSHRRISRSLGLKLSLTTPTASSLGDLRLRVQTLGQSSRIYSAYSGIQDLLSSYACDCTRDLSPA